MFEQYAEIILRTFRRPAGIYKASQIETLIDVIPLGEMDTSSSMDTLGESLSVDKHARRVFFEPLSQGRFPEQRVPFLIGRRFLEYLEAWRDWMTLENYLGQSDLQPKIVFLNDPVMIDGREYYFAEMRVTPKRGCERQYEFRP